MKELLIRAITEILISIKYLAYFFFFVVLPIISIIMPFYYAKKLIKAYAQNKKQSDTISHSTMRKIFVKLCISVVLSIVIIVIAISVINSILEPLFPSLIYMDKVH